MGFETSERGRAGASVTSKNYEFLYRHDIKID